MNRPQKIYTTLVDIHKDIDEVKNKIAGLVKQSEDATQKAELFFKNGNGDDCRFWKEKAKDLMASAGRLENGKLRRLKETVSSFRTFDLFQESHSINLQP